MGNRGKRRKVRKVKTTLFISLRPWELKLCDLCG